MSVNYYEPPHIQQAKQSVHNNTPNWPPSNAPVKKGILRRFFSTLGATLTFIRNSVMNLIFLLIALFIILAIVGSAPQPLPTEFILKIKPRGELVDQLTYVDPTSLLLADEESLQREVLVRDVVEAIGFAAKDERVKGIYLDPSSILVDDISKLAEIGQALEKFKASGKKVIAAANNYSQGQYYLATFADEIHLHQLGSIWLLGLSRHSTYLHTALEKLGVNIHTFRVGKFKDAIEPLLRDDMSEASREHNQEWVNMLWKNYTAQIETARSLHVNSLTNLINNTDNMLSEHKGDMGQFLLANKLIDGIHNSRDMNATIHNSLGKNKNDKRYTTVEINEYLAEKYLLPELNAQNIALIVAAGNISEGNQPDGSIGDQTLIKKLKEARSDNSIKAVVLRIDSGGGSAFASDLIYDEIKYLRSKGKPVFVSMGRYAASGGYYIAAGANEIWAQPTTLTGSIGVFGIWPTLENSLKKLGINTDGVSTTDIATTTNNMLPLPEKSQRILQQSVEFTYNRFISIVANERNKTLEEVDAIAQGRVWTGEKALALGLVDKLGSLQDTIEAAAAAVDLEEYGVITIEREKSAKEELLLSLASSHIASLAPTSWLESFSALTLFKQLSPALSPLESITQIEDNRGILLYCLECQHR